MYRYPDQWHSSAPPQKVVLDISGGHRVTSIITMASLRDLGLRVGSRATAVIKSSEVMLMV